MLNQTTIMGRLVRDPELRRTGTGIPVASFTIACDRDFAPKDGGEKQTDFVDCVAWRQTGEFVSKYFQKGAMIVVVGRLEQRHWTDKEGNKRSTLEINVSNAYFGEGKKQDGSAPQSGGYSAPQGGYAAPQGGYAAPQGGYAAPQGGGYAAPQGGGYAAPTAPQSGYAAPAAPQPGYGQPAAPGANYAVLDGDDAQLPF